MGKAEDSSITWNTGIAAPMTGVIAATSVVTAPHYMDTDRPYRWVTKPLKTSPTWSDFHHNFWDEGLAPVLLHLPDHLPDDGCIHLALCRLYPDLPTTAHVS
jgi:hypothetical protein